MNWKYLAIAAVSTVAGAGSATAQQAVDDKYDFKAGDLIRIDNGTPSPWVVKIVSCDPPAKRFRECQAIKQQPDLEEHLRPFTMENYVGKMTLVGHADAAATAPATRAAPVAPRAPAQAAATGACPRSAYGGPVPGTRAASAALFRQKITDSITMQAYGPYWYGVQLSNFTVGAPVRNTVGMNNTGANRVTNGAPVGATLYPVSTTMSVCEGAPTSSSAWRTSQKKYFCFVSKDNEWTCGATN